MNHRIAAGLALLSLAMVLGHANAAGAQPAFGTESEVAPKSDAKAQTRPQVAFGDGGYLAVWQRGIGARSDIHAARIGRNGKVRDPEGVEVSTAKGGQHHPAVAFGHGNYLVLWSDLRGDDYDLYGTRVKPDGSIAAAKGFKIADGDGNQVRPDVEKTADGFIVTWQQSVERGYQLMAATLDKSGKPKGSPVQLTKPESVGPEKLSNRVTNKVAVVNRPRVAVLGEKAIVVWEGTADRADRYRIMFRVLDAATAKPTKKPKKIWDFGGQRQQIPDIAAGSDDFLVTWQDLRGRGNKGGDGNARLLASDGSFESQSLIPLGTGGGREVRAPAVAANGDDFVIAFVQSAEKRRDAPQQRLTLRTVTDDGKSPGKDAIVSTGGFWPALAYAGTDDGLIVYTRLPMTGKAGARVVFRKLSASN